LTPPETHQGVDLSVRVLWAVWESLVKHHRENRDSVERERFMQELSGREEVAVGGARSDAMTEKELLDAYNLEDDNESLHNSYAEGTVVSGLTMSSAFAGFQCSGNDGVHDDEAQSEPYYKRQLYHPPGFAPSHPGLHEQNDDNGNSESFSNLAAVLGTGLAQSMEDAANERQLDSMAALNIHRQSRHVASRLPRHDTGSTAVGAITDPSVTQAFPASFSRSLRQGTGAELLPTDSNSIQSLSGLSSTAREFLPTPQARNADTNAKISGDDSVSSEITSRRAEMELRPYIWDIGEKDPSRMLLILHVSYLRVPDVRAGCEKFGVVESFRADFSDRGFYFVTYYDIRSAEYAAVELQADLQRLSIMQRSHEDVMVWYCLPLNSSGQMDETQIVMTDVPDAVTSDALRRLLASYGSIRKVERQSTGTHLIEFHNVQDTKQALLEIESSQPFGPDCFVEMAVRNQSTRKKGRELLALISKWRQHMSHRQNNPATEARTVTESSNHWTSGSANPLMSAANEVVGMGAAYGGVAGGGTAVARHRPETQLVLGPDGRYTPVLVQNPIQFSSFAPHGATPIDTRHQQIIQGPNGQIYLAPVAAAPAHVYQHGHMGIPGGYPQTIITARHPPSSQHSYFSHGTDAGSLSGRSYRSAYSTGTEGEKDNRHLMLDLESVENGKDTRTSLMVRNIPNKYTQRMLLSEFEENGHGPGVIDFFYLPIDFKNRCNRGYAFINFVNFSDILAFHQLYYGKHWRTFNSDKICDITYARIQGKAAMLKRFENSALMEKDEEYKPLVFASTGPDKGSRLPFPDTSTARHI